jgi:8-amino-7-oxononanoate synthase
MGTLGKAAGLSGAFVAGSTLLVDHLVQHGRSYVFSTAPAPAVAGAVPQALALIGGGDQRRARLHRLRSELCAQGAAWRRPPPAGATPIVPIVVGKAQEAMRLTDALAAQGVLVAGIRPPTVAAGSSRLRISLSAAHESADIDALVIAGMAVGL